MATASQLNIDELMYPTLELRTNPKHDAQGDKAGTQLSFGQQVQPLDNRPGKYALIVSVGSNDEASKNPPYKFIVEAYAVVSINGEALEGDAAATFIMTNGLPILIGGIRERIAEMTARAPWGRFLVNAIPLPESQSVNSI